MNFKKKMAAAAVLSALAATSLIASAQTIRIANQGDSLSLDPHSLNESLQLSTTANVYETLAGRNKDLSLAPLALEAKEGLALINGTQLMGSLLALALADARTLLGTANLAAAMTVEALSGGEVVKVDCALTHEMYWRMSFSILRRSHR